MAQKKKSVMEQIQSVGEDAIGKITKNPATRSALQGASQLKDKGGKMLVGLEALDKRLASIEKRLAALEGKGKKPATTTRSRSTASKTSASTAAKPRTTAAKPRTTAAKAKNGTQS
ncbi:MAG TPA: hypothetical protein VH063_07945 [Gaiellaceae bacterium]|jgi:hypothetical protein|nr:hypothetical protein [Gaiellaceae bacterium]